MEPPAYRGYGAVQTEKAKVLQAMRPLTQRDVVRGQYSRLSKRAERCARLRRRDLLRRATAHRFLALERRALVPALREISSRDRRRSAGGAEAAAGEAVRRFRSIDGTGQLLAFSSFPARRGCARCSRKASRQGIHWRPGGAVHVRRAARCRGAVRATAQRCDDRRWSALHPRGCGRGGLDRDRSGAEASSQGSPVQARHMGSEGGRRSCSGLECWHNPTAAGTSE